jgi:hypothetical protein
MGECSSSEERYKWRKSFKREVVNTDDSRRRIKYGWEEEAKRGYEVKQFRTEAADVANTILKMACKRAQVAMTLNVTAASDCFTQDLEDMPEELRDAVVDEHAPRGKPATEAPKSRGGNGLATEKQRNLVSMKLEQADLSAEALCKHLGISSIPELPFTKVNDALAWISENA